jgi:hypothetical protein
VSDTPTPPLERDCPRCGLRPCRVGQRLCGPCHAAYKRARRATRPPAQDPSAATPPGGSDGVETVRETMPPPEETPEGWALGLADRVLHAPDAPLLKGRRPGRQLPDDWRARFLEHHAEHGVRWRGARYAGVSYDALVAAERADPDFARAVENARQTYLDRHMLNLNRLAFEKDNVVGSIVALKAGRPSEYLERAISVNANFTASLDPQAGAALLATMLGGAQPLLPLPPTEPADSP